MNKIIVAAWIAIALVSFVSCGSDKKQQAPPPVKQEEKPLSPEEQMKADVSQKMKAELGSSKKMLNIIAGFSFGMNADQVERHTMKMTGRKALRKVKKGKNKVEYVYQ